MPDFTTLLQTNSDEVEAPKPLPPGNYDFTITGHSFGKSSQKSTDYVDFACQPINAREDVDQDALQAALKGGELSKKSMRQRFYITEDSLFRVKKFLTETLGIDGTGRSISAMIDDAKGQVFVGTVSQRIIEGSGDVISEITQTAKAE